jgi:hypothetical protein
MSGFAPHVPDVLRRKSLPGRLSSQTLRLPEVERGAIVVVSVDGKLRRRPAEGHKA